MKRFSVISLTLLLSVRLALAAEVLAEQADHTAGQVFGGLGGVLLGGAAGGPVGALAGAALGAWAGAGAQGAAGLSETAYRVRGDDGRERLVRSPRLQFQPGERVSIRGRRLAPSEH
ncbi:hypothetical protein [Pseudomonas zhanjiangensis]|uniref:Outer membrane lipoprotein SlyB n=1 Tax=Pseudomonas zhanjiangensis TaxID=3239015 RepID=A0ABV3YR86_9PSED